MLPIVWKRKTNYVENKDEKEPIVFFAYKKESEEKNSMDIRASNHMYGFKNNFGELCELKNNSVKFE